MAVFESVLDYHDFAAFVRRKARHILDEANQRFISAVVESAEARKVRTDRGDILWRAQLAFDWGKDTLHDEHGNLIDIIEFPCPANKERMIPFTDRATEGRVNPKGIPCLYLSTEKSTAMSEVRPWVGSYVSVAQFVVLRDLRLVDCSADTKRGSGFLERVRYGTISSEAMEKEIWNHINRAFSQPVTRTDDVADYAPTQVLAEAFRSAGFDGIVYGSGLGTGKTVAIFDVSAADLINCEIHQVKSVEFKFTRAGNTCYDPRYYSDSGKFAIPGETAESPGHPGAEGQDVADQSCAPSAE